MLLACIPYFEKIKKKGAYEITLLSGGSSL
jgi:hypothetical protein